VVNLLDRRIDYVEQNVKTVQKQLEVAENRLAAASVISTPEVLNEDGLPMTEIMEELDDEGNIISSSIRTPSDTKPQLLEVLHKAGIKDLPREASSSIEVKEPPASSSQAVVHTEKVHLKSTKKEVVFAEDTKPGAIIEKSVNAQRLEEVMRRAKESEAKPTEAPVIPANEAPEDAALRREMLQYSMSDVGAIVAELKLEDGSDWEEEDYEEEEDTESSDDEDAFGRSKKSVIDDKLRRKMIELEERLGVRAMENIGKKASDYETVTEGIGRVTINTDKEAPKSNLKSDNVEEDEGEIKVGSNELSGKKSVRFAESLDISPGPKSVETLASEPRRTQAPVSDVIERNVPTQVTAPASQKKPSRFKAARAGNNLNGPLSSPNSSLTLFPAKPTAPRPFSTPIVFTSSQENKRTIPTGPSNKTLATTIIERDIPSDVTPSEPDELDPALLNQEVATEYHKMRNRMIQRQGGFLKEEESEIVPFTEEEGGPRKVSRFMAARLARQ
jgi:unconventional prefoldin RPB5 interactor 1